MRYKDGGIIMSGHAYRPVPGFEGLVDCATCGCAEGTLPTNCPGVRVPHRVQTLIINGVVDYVGGRWIGKRRPLVLTIRFTSSAVRAAKSIRDFFPANGRTIALGRLFAITGQDRVACEYDRRVTRTRLQSRKGGRNSGYAYRAKW